MKKDNRRDNDLRSRVEDILYSIRNYDYRNVPIWVHILAVVIIVGVIVFSVVKLLLWNKGTAELDKTETGSMEVEIQDVIFLLGDEKKAGHVFDDEETIVFLGNDSLTFDYSETGVAAQVASKLGANVINCGFPASTIAQKNAEYTDDYPLDAYCFKSVADCIASGDFSILKANQDKFEDYNYTRSAENLEELDFDKVDTIVIYYNAQDYINLMIGMNPDNEDDPITYRGALNAGIKEIQEKYPFIRIVCMSFTMCYAFDSSGQIVSGDRYDFGNGKLTTYYQFMMDVCGERGVSFVDNYYGTIHEDNSYEWMLDNIHVNIDCNEHVAQHFVEAIYPKNE